MSDSQQETKTTAQLLQFQLQWLGVMSMSGREEEADKCYQKAQEYTQQLIDAGH